MSLKALDHSSRLSDPQGFARAARNAGYAAVLRYLPLPPGTLSIDAVGRLTASEIAAYHAAGLGVGIVWETTQMRPLAGKGAGLSDGIAARSAANALEFPPGHPIFAAVDFNPPASQWSTIAAYLQSGNFEPYANGPLLTYLDQLGFRHSWMHNWGGNVYRDPHIHQQGGQVTIAGIACDLNDVYHSDCIWWPGIHVASTGGGQFLHEGENMRVDAKIPAAAVVAGGIGWVDIVVPTGLGVTGVVMNGADALDGQPLPTMGWAARDIGGGKWRVNFYGAPAGGCDLHIGLG